MMSHGGAALSIAPISIIENNNLLSPTPSAVVITTGGREKLLKIISAIILSVLIVTTIVIVIKKNLSTIRETTAVSNDTATTEAATATIAATTATTSNNPNDIIFTAQITYASSNKNPSFPISLVVADVNNDHKPDIIVANELGDSVGILLNDGRGLFRLDDYSIGSDSHPQHVSIGDLNGDNAPDIAVTTNDATNFFLLFNDGYGAFPLRRAYPRGSSPNPSSLALADFNNDSKLDIIATGQNSGAMGVFFNSGDDTFTIKGWLGVSTVHSPTSLLIVDINEDSKPDVAFTDLNFHSVGIVSISKNGEYDIFAIYDSFDIYPTGTESRPTFVAVADVNEDDKLDLIVANSNANNVGVLLNSGDGTFRSQRTYPTGKNSNPRCVSIADLNRDNKPEIIVANHNQHTVGILVNIGNGKFILEKIYHTGNNSYPRFVSVVDVNGDDKPDIIVANSESSNIGVFLAA